MSILDIRNKATGYRFRKTIIIYIVFSLLAFTINKVYALYGHGVSSQAMTWMFLYPLIGGGLLYLLLGTLLPELNRFRGYRLFYNIYNSGIALLTIGSLLKGILQIAGTGSVYLKFYYTLGYIMTGAGILLMLVLAINYKKSIPENLSRNKPNCISPVLTRIISLNNL